MQAKRRPRQNPISSFLMFSITVTMFSTGAFGLVPNSPFAQQYLDLVAITIPPEFITPVNQFLTQVGAPTIPEDRYFNQDEDPPLDPGGWILQQFGADVPPITSESETALDPAGALFEIFGIETDNLSDPEIPRDPIGELAALFGVELEGGTYVDISPLLDPGGNFLSLFIKEEYLYPSEQPYNPLMDPGGVFLGLFFPQELLGPSKPNPFLVYNASIDPVGFILGESSAPVATAGNPNPGVDVVGYLFQVFPALQVNGNPSVTLGAPSGGLSFTFNQAQVAPSPSATENPTPSPEASATEVSTAATEAPSIYQPLSNLAYIPAAPLQQTSEEQLQPAAAVAVAPVVPPPTSAIVNSTLDPGTDGICDATECTLREAVNVLTAGGVIYFDSTISGSTITLFSVININTNLSINGSGSNMTISGNSSNPIFAVNSGNVTVYGLTLTNGVNSGNGGAIIFNGGTLTVYSCTLTGNNGANGGGIYHNSTGYLSVAYSTFSNNNATNSGGGIFENGTGHLYVQNSRFLSNMATSSGGGIYSTGSNTSVVDIQNSIFYSNQTDNGGAIYFSSGSPQLRNSTLVDNFANTLGDSIYNSADLSMSNNILRSNHLVQIFDSGGAVMNYNNIENNTFGGTNIDSDPLFVNPTGLDFSLGAGSPSIDTGSNTNCTAKDFNDVTRPVNVCDMGAYEQ